MAQAATDLPPSGSLPVDREEVCRRGGAGDRAGDRRTPTTRPPRSRRPARRGGWCAVPPTGGRCRCRTWRARPGRGTTAVPRARRRRGGRPTHRCVPTAVRRRRRRWRRPGGSGPAPRGGAGPSRRRRRGARAGPTSRRGPAPVWQRTRRTRRHGRANRGNGPASRRVGDAPTLSGSVAGLPPAKGQPCREYWIVWGEARYDTAGGSSPAGWWPRSCWSGSPPASTGSSATTSRFPAPSRSRHSISSSRTSPRRRATTRSWCSRPPTASRTGRSNPPSARASPRSESSPTSRASPTPSARSRARSSPRTGRSRS